MRIFCELRGGVAGGELGAESSPPVAPFGLCSGVRGVTTAGRTGDGWQTCGGCCRSPASLHRMSGYEAPECMPAKHSEAMSCPDRAPTIGRLHGFSQRAWHQHTICNGSIVVAHQRSPR